MKYLPRVKLNKSDKILISLIGLLLIGLTLSSSVIRSMNHELSTIRTKLGESESREAYDSDMVDHESHMSSVYRERLMDLQMHIGSPEKIGYQLPYDSNDCEVRFRNSPCVYLDESYYENNGCVGYKQSTNPTPYEKSTREKYPNFNACKDIYQRYFEAWNPSS